MDAISRRKFLAASALAGAQIILPSAAQAEAKPEEDIDRDSLAFLHGPYEPLKESDQKINFPLNVIQGQIPVDLQGTFIQSSSNPQFPETIKKYSWFDGDGMLHQVHFGAQQARFTNRFVQTEKFKAEKRAGKKLYDGIHEMGTVNGISYFVQGKPLGENTSNTALMNFANRTFSLWWMGGDPYEINPLTLETVGPTLKKILPKGMTAHPKVDPRTGELLFYANAITTTKLTAGILTADLKLRTREFTLPRRTYFHDMGFTENYIIMYVCPTGIDMTNPSTLTFFEKIPTEFYVINRKTLSTTRCLAEPGFVFHTANCWEEDGKLKIYADFSPYPALPIPEVARRARLTVDQVPHTAGANILCQMTEWIFDLQEIEKNADNAFQPNPASVWRDSMDIFDKTWMELPTVNPVYMGQKNRYAYASKMALDKLIMPHGLLKYDLQEKRLLEKYVFPETLFGGEGQFVPRESARAEDDGYVLQMIYSNKTGTRKSEMWIFDAQKIEQGPITKMILPVKAAPGFHSIWVPKERK